MKTRQADTNPYKYTDSNKRYYTYDYYLRQRFDGKCEKIPLDCGFTCPNIDGRCGVGGCIYCSARGSGDFAADSSLPIYEQYLAAKKLLSAKWNAERIIPYFQAHTNTYAPEDRLRRLYDEALALPGAVGLNIATRADCLGEDILPLLRELSEKTALTVELGLQSADDETARIINRGHTYAQFVSGYNALRTTVPKAEICVHLMLGLPGEDAATMLGTARAVARLRPNQVKLHLLYVLRGTPLGDMFLRGEYTPMTRENYVSVLCDTLELLPPDTVIGRVTGDAPPDELLAPEWSRKKFTVMNEIDKELYRRGSYQGIKFVE